MAIKLDPAALLHAVKHIVTGKQQSSGKLAGKKVNVVEPQQTEGLRDKKGFSLKPRKLTLSKRQSASSLGQALIKVGFAKATPSPPIELKVYASLPKNVLVPDLQDVPKEKGHLGVLNDVRSKEESIKAAESLTLTVEDRTEGSGQYGEVRAAVPSGDFNRKPARAFKTTFNQSRSIEIEVHSRLEHKNIASLKDAWRSDELLRSTSAKDPRPGHAEALVMEYVPQSMSDVISPRDKMDRLEPHKGVVPEKFKALRSRGAQPLPQNMLKKAGFGILSGLNYMHQQNPSVGHFDIHPGNILVAGDGTPKITDFGCAKEFDEDGGMRGGSSFNAKYNGPELWSDPPELSTKVDMWGLGCTLFEGITGTSLCPMSPLSKDTPEERAEFIIKSAGDALKHPILQQEQNTQLKDLLNKLLKANPAERLSAEEAMAHPFFAGFSNKD